MHGTRDRDQTSGPNNANHVEVSIVLWQVRCFGHTPPQMLTPPKPLLPSPIPLWWPRRVLRMASDGTRWAWMFAVVHRQPALQWQAEAVGRSGASFVGLGSIGG